MIQLQYQYYLITEIATKNENAEWWMNPLDMKRTVRMSNGFKTATKALRKTVKDVMNDQALIPSKSEHYEHMKRCSEYGDAAQILDIVYNIMKDPKWNLETSGIELPYLHKVDDLLHLYAFIGNPDLIHFENEGKSLEMNIQNMDDDRKPYFVTYYERDEKGDVVRKINITMLNNSDAKIKKFNLEYPLSDYETLTFGVYKQDEKGETASPLTWRILHEENGLMLLLTEKVIDYMPFSSGKNDDWLASDIRQWLNTDFYNDAFSSNEKDCIECNLPDNSKVFLLSIGEHREYFPEYKEAKTGYTDYAWQRTRQQGRYMDTPYAGWLLRSSSSPEWGGTDHVVEVGYSWFGVSNDSPNGIRPAIWVRKDAIR